MKTKEYFDDDNLMLLDEDIPFQIQEAYKIIRTNLKFTMQGKKSKSVIVTSAEQSDGKSVTAINLALALASNDERVLLIDCDLRLPTVAQKLKLLTTPGLTNYIYGMNDYNDIIQVLPSGLHVITSGDVPPNPSETLGSQAMADLIAMLSEEYDYIIMDTPPILVVTDAAILANNDTGVIIVVRQNVSTREGINDAVEQLRMTNANILGFVITGGSVSVSTRYRRRRAKRNTVKSSAHIPKKPIRYLDE